MVDLNGIKVKNRFLVSSGALGYGGGWPWQRPLIWLRMIDPTIFGAVVTKTLTLEPRKGNFIDPIPAKSFFKKFAYFWTMFSQRRKVLRSFPPGWVNRLSLWNVGIDYFLDEIYPGLKNINLIVSIGGDRPEEYLALIEKLSPLKIAAIELNISCPSVNLEWQSDIKQLCQLFYLAVKKSAEAKGPPLIVKIGPHQDFKLIAYFAQWYGIRAVHIFNTLPYRIYDKKERTWFEGGLSGPMLKHITLGGVLALKKEIWIPIIAGGGIDSWKDCLDSLETGADAVTFGSVFLSVTRFWLPTSIAKKYGKQKDPI